MIAYVALSLYFPGFSSVQGRGPDSVFIFNNYSIIQCHNQKC